MKFPLILENAGLGKYIVQRLKLNPAEPELSQWKSIIANMRAANEVIRVAVVGKYVELHDAYMSVKEALFHAATVFGKRIEIVWVNRATLKKQSGTTRLKTWTVWLCLEVLVIVA
jgi:CTP synthase